MATISISVLKHIGRHSGKLHQSKITESSDFQTFDDLCHFIVALRYPKPQTHKHQTYGWTPTIYDFSEQTIQRMAERQAHRRDLYTIRALV